MNSGKRMISIWMSLLLAISFYLPSGIAWAGEEELTEPVIRMSFEGDLTNSGSSGLTPVLAGGNLTYETEGVSGQAVAFANRFLDGDVRTAYIDLGSELGFGEDVDFTIAFWIKAGELDRWPAVISNKLAMDDTGLQLFLDVNGQLRWQLTTEGNEKFTDVYMGQVNDGFWHHAAVTHDRDGFAHFYFDGVKLENKSVDLSQRPGSVDSEYSFKVGASGAGTMVNYMDQLNISLDELQIYRRVLSSEEVEGLTKLPVQLELDHLGAIAVGDRIKQGAAFLYGDKTMAYAAGGVTFQSSDNAVAEIEPYTGMITAKSAGETVISAHYGSLSAQYTLEVSVDAGNPDWLNRLSSQHPRLMVTDELLTEFNTNLLTDAHLQLWYEDVEGQAQNILEDEVYDPLNIKRIELLAFMYQVTEDQVYAERGYEELASLAAKAGWSPDYFLNHAAYLISAAVGYDWFYQAWTEEQRMVIRDAIITKGLLPARTIYRYETASPYLQAEWPGRVDNWNVVGNSGVIMAALAVGEHAPALADEVLAYALNSLPVALAKTTPDGGWYEGISYWSYMWNMLVRALAALDTALGEGYHNLTEIAGMADTGNFPIYMTGPTQRMYNFSDSYSGTSDFYQMFWLARHYDKPEFTQYQALYTDIAANTWGVYPLSSLWYQPEHMTPSILGQVPLDRLFSDSQVASMRSSWEDPEAIFVAFKAGDNNGSHADLDLGSFIVEAAGERWAEDMGMGRDDWTYYYNNGPNGYRWQYYINRAEGHNTLVINPKTTNDPWQSVPDQNPLASTALTEFESRSDLAYGIMDLSTAYSLHDAVDVKRGIALLNDRKQVLVQDEIMLDEPGEIWWFMHLNGEVTAEIASDKQSAILQKNGKRLWVGLAEAVNGAEFVVQDAKPFPGSPNPSDQITNPITPDQSSHTPSQKLSLHLSDTKQARLPVLMQVLQPGESAPAKKDRLTAVALYDWAEALGQPTEEPGVPVEPAQPPQSETSSDPTEPADVQEEKEVRDGSQTGYEQSRFLDIRGHWAEEALSKALELNWLKGYEDGLMRPDQAINRAQFVVLLSRASAWPNEAVRLSFTDKQKIPAWSVSAVSTASRLGIVVGYEDGSFRPSNAITRAEMAAMIARAIKVPAAGSPTTGFADDAAFPNWARGYIAALVQAHLIQGREGNRFAAHEMATRAEAVVMLLRAQSGQPVS
ncbi:S-layer homology domain-containing protein [Paenibacillus sp. IITD108]|uniref:S-layer homology domain-containing protein n=1 Tax=Paenibacillus sp. IITD108 TaxID=3116649 RepID=UPI002F3E8F18